MLRALGGFLAVMVLGTVISRAAASALVAQVETKKGALPCDHRKLMT